MHKMKKLPLLQLILLALAMVSCGTDSRHFHIDGRLLHLGQGEFYVYSPDGGITGLDTIKLDAGRFSYEVECDRPMTLMIVFPNFTEQPVFAEPGKSVKLRGDASHLKEMTVKGTRDNELMNSLREQLASSTPQEAVKCTRQFVADHPESPVGVWLVGRYLIQAERPDYAAATQLVDKMMAAQPGNGYLKRLRQQLAKAPVLTVGSPMPRFAAKAVDSTAVSTQSLSQVPTVVFFSWASWRYESTSALRRVWQAATESGGKAVVVGVSADASVEECRRSVSLQNVGCPVLCDGLMMDSPLLRTFALSFLPDNVVFRHGRVVAMHLSTDQLIEEMRK